MLKSISEDSHKLIKVNRRSTLTDNQLEDCYSDDIFTDEITDEFSKYSGESDENKINTTPPTSSFKIIPSETDGNCPYNTLKNIVFDGQLIV